MLAALAPVSCGGADGAVGMGHPGADARTVVAEYIRAIDEGDSGAAKRLMTPKFADRVADAEDSWFTNTSSIRDVRIGRLRREQDDSSDGVRFFRAVYVPVDFTVDVKRESSIQDGRMTWGYLLVKRDRAAPWLIDQDGVG